MKVDHQVFIEGATPQQIWDTVHDLRNDHKWWKTIEETKVIKGGDSIDKGTVYTQHSHMLGIPVDSIIEVVKFEPPWSMTINNNSGTIPFLAKYTISLSEDGNGSNYRMQAVVDLAGMLVLLGPVVKLVLLWQVRHHFNELKKYLEGIYNK